MSSDDIIIHQTEDIPISLNTACKILRKGKAKVRKLIGTRIRIIDRQSNSYSLNMSDVLGLIGKI